MKGMVSKGERRGLNENMFLLTTKVLPTGESSAEVVQCVLTTNKWLDVFPHVLWHSHTSWLLNMHTELTGPVHTNTHVCLSILCMVVDKLFSLGMLTHPKQLCAVGYVLYPSHRNSKHSLTCLWPCCGMNTTIRITWLITRSKYIYIMLTYIYIYLNHCKKGIAISTSDLLSYLHAWTENSVNIFVKNLKTHYSNELFLYQTFTHLHHKQVVWHLWCRWVILAFLTNCLWCKW